ncbi:peptidoglycan/xylan/chitin deacetylase (PgdA/CDA1 family) [Pontibacter ummariensis]|uniref:Peptidoglycan/xylan/chitin deacetylase, PgdA/CDA1 family n=1 Tax=Pontibacter ummariensis TaxID=1610492 RepID=A0A239D6F9_9BACT|nr:polysaccharide deacetylase family protein [Pontibacter ummariensis]PRY14253.1 peptidoglycan/xylan/chitin deacetylase (PgdA/CDA1 family) [Pontibacter ummariensis]SNS27444.1 Peptidoglycan/xylan/chitin deacetylase, PgdA/CDA1 family [Pontibacter ummariensis]
MLFTRTLTFLLCLCSLSVSAQWNKKKAAVVLTYDDALNVHLDKAIPALDSLNLKGTFYLKASAPAFTQRLQEWEKAAANKHELANHTLYHPCDGSKPGRSFVTPDYDLATYSLRRITDEIKMTNAVLQAVDGKKDRTFAYPCGDTTVGGVSYMDHLKGDFVAARGVHGEMVPKTGTDLYNVGSYVINGQTGEELIALVKEAEKKNSMVVFLFHGVGGEHSLNVSEEAHSKLLHYLKEHEKEIWNPTFVEAAQYLKKTGKSASKANQ